MKKALIIGAAIVCAAGCQTRITAEKNAEQMKPCYRVANINGTNQLYVAGYQVGSGGWYATARSPLWADEAIKGFAVGVDTNGTVSMKMDDYHRDLSTNAVVMTRILCDTAANITAKVCAAIVSQGGSVAAEGTISAVKTAVANYLSKGGTSDGMTITTSGNDLLISDGNISETCVDCVPTLTK